MSDAINRVEHAFRPYSTHSLQYYFILVCPPIDQTYVYKRSDVNNKLYSCIQWTVNIYKINQTIDIVMYSMERH